MGVISLLPLSRPGGMSEQQKHTCYHCGDNCSSTTIVLDDKYFCCRGCRTVYEILSENDLVEYYTIEKEPGTKKEETVFTDYAFLDIPEIKKDLLSFAGGGVEKVTFSSPEIHCSSCIWLLENLNRINAAISKSEVNFLKKEVSLQYNSDQISLRKVAEVMNSIGYPPLVELKEKERQRANRRKDLSYIYKLGISGFAFGNIMLLSFPEYFSEGMYEDQDFGAFFGLVNLLLALPVFFYCSSSYFSSAWKGLRHGFLNIDVPISLGIIVLFGRSAYEILAQSGPGYFDSMTGLVFFLLVGRWFQNRTYQALSFERDYRSYFPLGVVRIREGARESVLLKDIDVGDEILVNHGDIIPADASLREGSAHIDYSFVTGEAEPVLVEEGQSIYAGGRQQGGQIRIRIEKAFSQSYLMQLWKHEEKSQTESKELGKLIDKISHYFTGIILFMASLAFVYWYFEEPRLAFHAFSSVLIIACPCALALTIPFTFGNGIRLLEKAGFYLRDARFIEVLASIDTIIFDKTGTITMQKTRSVEYEGQPLTEREKAMIKGLVAGSNHPLSRAIYNHLSGIVEVKPDEFEEVGGKGLHGKFGSDALKMGSASFTGMTGEVEGSAVYLMINQFEKGVFVIRNLYREGLSNLASKLSPKYQLNVITGDGDGERKNLENIFGKDTELKFRMDPFDKRNFILDRKREKRKVLMIGDGLNDAGAIKESSVGVSISDDIYGFLPSCDAILEASEFDKLDRILLFSGRLKNLVVMGFVISFIYNIIGLSFAVQGVLSPVIAAVLMPLSSVSVVTFAIFSTNVAARKYKIF